MNIPCKTGLLCAAITLLIGCKGSQQKDLLLGKWEVKDIIRDGSSIVGPGFHGSSYWFRDNGTVLAWNFRGDTIESQYTRSGDSLFWVNMDGKMLYMIDSLSDDYLGLLMDQDGIQSKVMLKKVTTD